MTIDTKRKAGEIAAEVPGAAKVLEAWGVDYCCGGNRSLEQACATAGAPLGILRETLEKELLPPAGDGSSFRDWSGKSCSDIIRHILETHHSFERDQARRLGPLMNKVALTHWERHPGLWELKEEVEEILVRLENHMDREEKTVFQFLLAGEKAGVEGKSWTPPESALDYLEALEWEHELVGSEFRKIHRLTDGFRVPPDGCAFYRELYDGLRELEEDLHRHVHLENNILFRRAREEGLLPQPVRPARPGRVKA